MTVLETIQHGNVVIDISRDDYPEDPRAWPNLGTMVCWHRRYTLGDKHSFADPSAFRAEITGVNAVILPLFLYDHSGITMNTTGFSCPWDSGQVGFIYVTKDRACAEFGAERLTQKIRDKVVEILRAEVAAYDAFLTGDVFGFELYRRGGRGKRGVFLDSCWGIYGRDHCVEQAKAIAEQVQPAPTRGSRRRRLTNRDDKGATHADHPPHLRQGHADRAGLR